MFMIGLHRFWRALSSHDEDEQRLRTWLLSMREGHSTGMRWCTVLIAVNATRSRCNRERGGRKKRPRCMAGVHRPAMRQQLRRRWRCECRRGSRVGDQRRHRVVVEYLEQRHCHSNSQPKRPLGSTETIIAASKPRASILRKQHDFQAIRQPQVGGGHGLWLKRLCSKRWTMSLQAVADVETTGKDKLDRSRDSRFRDVRRSD